MATSKAAVDATKSSEKASIQPDSNIGGQKKAGEPQLTNAKGDKGVPATNYAPDRRKRRQGML